MSKAPAFQWYPKDCDTDENVRLMDDAEFGFYVRCLNHAWLNDGLPEEVRMIGRLFHKSADDIERLWDVVGKCFTLTDGRFVNSRQEAQREEHASFKAKAKAAANARWDKKIPKANDPSAESCSIDAQPMRTHDLSICLTDAKPMRTQCTASASASASASESPLPPFSKTEDPSDLLERLYSAHPKKGARGLAESYLASAIIGGVSAEKIERNHKLCCELEPSFTDQGGKFAPTLAKWLLDRGYNYPPKTTPTAIPVKPQRSLQSPYNDPMFCALNELEDRIKAEDAAKAAAIGKN